MAFSLDKLRDRLAKITDPAMIAKLEETATIDFQEHFAYQELQARCHASGFLDTRDATLIYRTLGPTLATWERQPLAERLYSLAILASLVNHA